MESVLFVSNHAVSRELYGLGLVILASGSQHRVGRDNGLTPVVDQHADVFPVVVRADPAGAEEVTIVYRRGQDAMPASGFEQELAAQKGVRLIFNAQPVTVQGPGTFLGKATRTLTFEPTDKEGWWFDRADLPNTLPVRVTIVLAIVMEIVAAIAVRDNLTLNVIMLLMPIDAIAQWQGMG